MKIVGIYSFNGGEKTVKAKYPTLLKEIEQVIESVDTRQYKTKSSKEKTMPGRMLYNPKSMNGKFKEEFTRLGWKSTRVECDYPKQFYATSYKPINLNRGAFREMDFIKAKLGVEVQFGKYAFMVYNVCAKMTIFHNLGFIDTGVEIVPAKDFAEQMSTGVSYFEQFVWDLEQRGVADIDIPVLILGVSA